MKAVICKKWGDPSTLTVGELPGRPPRENEVRVGVHACGVNFADTLMIAGKYQVRPDFPFSPGLEIAGEVLEAGPGVETLEVGDRVIGVCDYGGFAEEVTLDARMLLILPSRMDYVTGAAFPVAYGTSHVALNHRARLQPGETLLVLGAAGGVGLTAVEIGKRMGAKVIAAASTPEKLAVAEAHGADYLINYVEEDLRERVREITGGAGADVIYDPVGGSAFDTAMRCINWEGRLLVIGFASGEIPTLPVNLTLVKNCSVMGVFWGAYAKRDPQVLGSSLLTLLGWYETGALNPHISQTYPLEDAPAALEALMSRKSTGKLVITTGRS